MRIKKWWVLCAAGALAVCGVSAAFTGDVKLEIPELSGPPSIDATEDPVWQTLPWHRFSDKRHDVDWPPAVVEFKAGWHGDSLYFFVVADVETILTGDPGVWLNDGVEFYIDWFNIGGAYATDDTGANWADGSGPTQIRALAEPIDGVVEGLHFGSQEALTPDQGEYAVAISGTTITFEVRLTPEPGVTALNPSFGFAMQYNDGDPDDGFVGAAYWAGGAMQPAGAFNELPELPAFWQNGDGFAEAGTVEAADDLVIVPRHQIATPGSTITLETVWNVEPAGDVTYEWRHNNQVIDGAVDATYTITNAAQTDVGEYRVIATDGEGAVYEAAASVQMWENLSLTNAFGLVLLIAAVLATAAAGWRRVRSVQA